MVLGCQTKELLIARTNELPLIAQNGIKDSEVAEYNKRDLPV